MANAVILASFRESPISLDTGPINGEWWNNIGGLYRLQVQAVVAGHEIMYGFQWLLAVLGADATLLSYATGGVWQGGVDDGTVPPYVIMSHQAGSDVLTMNAVRLMTTPLYQIRAIGPASLHALVVSAASRIDALIGQPPNGGSV